ncbi:hypothetical protein LF41_2499 [Lysobacter dokdonensis DS-58]|uniref:Uncharacterized protein n=1 Tax=Lysobacter dokdonensis DS-58 TaxID=1300345 RepID=A0A0A2WNX7_9GAMM|nr:hypothetical protein LF41_2499 [Lysobacter dokdonensis DS-58]
MGHECSRQTKARRRYRRACCTATRVRRETADPIVEFPHVADARLESTDT